MGMFGPSKKEIWEALSNEIRGRYDAGSFWVGDHVEALHGNWTLYLDTYTVSAGNTHVTYTRMRAPFVNPSGVRFKIYRKGFFSEMGKALGGQDLETGYEEFDEAFIIKGNQEVMVRRLFSDQEVRQLLMAMKTVQLEVKPDEGAFGPRYGEEEDVLTFMVPGILKDMAALRSLFDLFAAVLDAMAAAGAASTAAPGVKLYDDRRTEDPT